MKKHLYGSLIKKRQNSVYEGYHNLAEYHEGFYECNHVSPYSLGAGNLDAKVMYFLQDWIGHDRLLGPVDKDCAKFGCAPKLPTNRNLERWLDKYLGVKKQETFGTNIFPYIKDGLMSAGLKSKDINRAAAEFALPMINIVQPQVVIAFGLTTYNGLRSAAGLKKVSGLSEAIEASFKIGGAEVFCLAHPGQLGTNSRNRNNKTQVAADWEKVAQRIH